MAPARLSLSGKRWILPEDSVPLQHLGALLARLRSERGISRNTDTALQSPTIFPDMERATNRIRSAVDAGERIGIFGDYDCDGITAVAQLTRYFRRHSIDPFVRLPHRVRDGYGLNTNVVDEIIDADVDLLITADTGIGGIDEVKFLSENGVDVIITDHHIPGEELPTASAILHPSLSGYPEPHPSGAGVVLQLLRALEGGEWDDCEADMAMAMIGTIADVVPLRGDNRTIVQMGLSALENVKGPLAEFRERVQSSGRPITSAGVAFRIAPRINAAGRMDDPMLALKALLEGGASLDALDQLNAERQQQTEALLDEVMAELESSPLPPFLCVCKPHFPQGLIGLIAGKLTENFGRPSMVAHTDGVICTASLRSPKYYHVGHALRRTSDLLLKYGGHAQAAGATFRNEHLSALHTRLCEDIQSQIGTEDLVPTVAVDALIDAKNITIGFCEELLHLEPFGQGNAEPKFLLEHMTVSDVRRVGNAGAHLQCKIAGMKTVGFNLGRFEAAFTGPLDIVVRCGIDGWRGRREPELFVEDLREPAKAPRKARRESDRHEAV